MKKLLVLTLMVALVLSLGSCAYIGIDLKINKDGTVERDRATFGYSLDYANKYMDRDTLATATSYTYQGKTYIVPSTDEVEDVLDRIEHRIFTGDDSVTLTILGEDLNANDYSAVLDINISFPYEVVQVGGDTKGITINGNQLHLSGDLKSDSHYTFYAGNSGIFTDTNAAAWYMPAVYAMKANGLVSGYEDGTFAPDANITYAALCKMIANAAQVDTTPGEGEWWASRAVNYCVLHGYVDRDANWDEPATREVAIAAISRTGLLDKKAADISVIDNAGIVNKNIFLTVLGHTGIDGTIVFTEDENAYEVYSSTKGYIVFLMQGTNVVKNNCGYASATYDELLEEIVERNKQPTVVIPDFDDIDPEYRDDIVHAYENGLSAGKDAAGTFYPKENITRAEICQLFFNIIKEVKLS